LPGVQNAKGDKGTKREVKRSWEPKNDAKDKDSEQERETSVCSRERKGDPLDPFGQKREEERTRREDVWWGEQNA